MPMEIHEDKIIMRAGKYALPKRWVGLTDLEIAGFVKTMERGNFLVAIYDIEKKLKEKNDENK